MSLNVLKQSDSWGYHSEIFKNAAVSFERLILKFMEESGKSIYYYLVKETCDVVNMEFYKSKVKIFSLQNHALYAKYNNFHKANRPPGSISES